MLRSFGGNAADPTGNSDRLRKDHGNLRVSIIINTLNRADSLDRTLQSLRQLRYPDFEVIVVNGPSSDHTETILARHATAIRAARCDQANLSLSRNIGIALARGDIVAFIDDDAIPEPDWLDRLVEGYSDPNIASVGGFIRDHGGIDFQCKFVVADRFGDTEKFETLPGDLSSERYLSLTGTNSSFRRNILMQAGGFDEEFAYFLDETDVNLRLVDAGWKAAVVPDAEIHHKFEPSHLRTSNRIPRSMYLPCRSKAYFCCLNAIASHTLPRVVEYLAKYLENERRWKRGLFTAGKIDQTTCERLIAEVEKGVEDGIRDAFAQTKRRLLSPARLESSRSAAFTHFITPRRAADRLRLCFLSQDYPPAGNGGIGLWTNEVARGLAQRGHEVTVLCRSHEEHPYIDFVDGVWVHHLVRKAAPDNIHRSFADVPRSLVDYSATLLSEIERLQPRRDFQVVSGPLFDLEPLAALSHAAIPTVVSLHTTYKLALPHKPDWLSNSHYLDHHVKPTIAVEDRLLRTAPLLLANTKGLVADLEQTHGFKIDPARLTVVPHGLADASIGVERFERAEREFRLLFVGRLERRKGVDLLLEALPALITRHPNLVVDIVGDDQITVNGSTLRTRFETTHRRRRDLLRRVRFHGVLPRADVLRHFASCDAFVAPSRYESFGLVFVEAMMFGKPAIGFAVGGIPEVIADGKNGLLAARVDSASLAQRISYLIDNPMAAIDIGARARRSYEENFSSARMIAALERYYIAAVRHGTSSRNADLALATGTH